MFAGRNNINIAVAALLIWEFRKVLLLCVCSTNAVNVTSYEVKMMNPNTNKADIPICIKTQMQ
jgi:hypothetical protein